MCPFSDYACESFGTHGGECVILEIDFFEVGEVVKTIRDEVCYSFLSDSVLGHLDCLDVAMGGIGFCPRCHAAVFKSVPAADYELEVGYVFAVFSGGGFLGGQGGQRVGNENTCRGTEAVVIQI